ncbi:hypothetical protein DLAC_09195 [Tieghemostelium lacteum]|uniref:sn-1-specific diacylglycerol lipase n=1 Tax=Tieghemostelium lacteum TaxID=361077 RepID=A0A151Z9E8_TIELA|nr:hypothetical protein DLAC_09195 [Tieghemostelium lacteum]|eukprot:KYQ90567.1 hypothetical protein DLAC_09195 [Tieghemostelium lacteum]
MAENQLDYNRDNKGGQQQEIMNDQKYFHNQNYYHKSETGFNSSSKKKKINSSIDYSESPDYFSEFTLEHTPTSWIMTSNAFNNAPSNYQSGSASPFKNNGYQTNKPEEYQESLVKSPEQLGHELRDLLSITDDQHWEIRHVCEAEEKEEEEKGANQPIDHSRIKELVRNKTEESNIVLGEKYSPKFNFQKSQDKQALINSIKEEPEIEVERIDISTNKDGTNTLEITQPTTVVEKQFDKDGHLVGETVENVKVEIDLGGAGSPGKVKSYNEIIVRKSKIRKELKSYEFEGEGKDQINVISMLLKKLFLGTSYSTIDIFMGLSLLNRYYKEYVIRNWDCISDKELLDEAMRYAKFSTCSYGRKLYYGLMHKSAIGLVRSLTGTDVTNIKILKKHVGVSKEDIITSKWFSTKYSPGHFLAVDRETKSVVFVIRGTFNHFDVVTDLVAKTSEISKEGLAHLGILMCAHKKMYEMEKIILKTLYENKGYRFIVTGHSLGAGVASLFTILFNDAHPEVKIHCYSYGVPCILSYEMATVQRVKSLITSVCMNDDIIPRLCFCSLFYLREVLDSILSQSKTKFQKLFQIASARGKLSDKVKRRFSKMLKVSPVIDLSNVTHKTCDEKPMFPPGNIIRIVKLKKGIYVAEKTETQSFDKILVSATMFTDHMPNKYEKGLESAVENYNNIEYTKKPPPEEIIDSKEDIEFKLSQLNIDQFHPSSDDDGRPSVCNEIQKNQIDHLSKEQLDSESITVQNLIPSSLHASQAVDK